MTWAVMNRIAGIKTALFFVSLLPLAWLIWLGAQDALGANPVERITRYTGDWVLRFLLITLAVTPLRRLTGWNVLLRYRRMLGLYAFFYACVHFAIYVVDRYFSIDGIVEDIVERPYLTLGFACFVLLIPLAVTSTNAMVRKLGARRWQALHRLIYAIAAGGVVHFWWSVKSDITEPSIYAALLAFLLLYRLWHRLHFRTLQTAP